MEISSRQMQSQGDFLTCFEDLGSGKADLLLLILASQGIETRIKKQGRRYSIHVRAIDISRSHQAVKQYHRENRKKKLMQQIESLPLSSFYSPPAFLIMTLLAFIHGVIHYFGAHEQMVLQYGASALYIMQGEAFRAVTALFLHADSGHLLGNLAGLLIFAAPVISLSGYGTGPFMLLFTGTAGNLINAWAYRTAHLSIGASTAVMGAAGLMAAFQSTRKEKPFSFNSLMPVFAGAVLVGMFSGGEKTDVTAHIFGFLCGLISGLFFFPLDRIFSFKYKNRCFFLLTLFLVLAAFILKDKI